MVIARTQHHPVFAEANGLLVTIGSDMPDGQYPHRNSIIRCA
jgi:hypothetical protein